MSYIAMMHSCTCYEFVINGRYSSEPEALAPYDSNCSVNYYSLLMWQQHGVLGFKADCTAEMY